MCPDCKNTRNQGESCPSCGTFPLGREVPRTRGPKDPATKRPGEDHTTSSLYMKHLLEILSSNDNASNDAERIS